MQITPGIPRKLPEFQRNFVTGPLNTPGKTGHFPVLLENAWNFEEKLLKTFVRLFRSHEIPVKQKYKEMGNFE